MSAYDNDAVDETTHERPSSFREMLYRDRALLSRRQMDRLIRDRVTEREYTDTGAEDETDGYPTYFPALSRRFGSSGAEARTGITVVVLVVAAFLFGHWVGGQQAPTPVSETAPITSVI